MIDAAPVFVLFERSGLGDAVRAGNTHGTLHLLKPGTFPANPQDLTLTAADIAGIAASYNPAIYKAPVVIGHPEHDEPAHGWVHALKHDAAGLWAEIEIFPELAGRIAAGEYRTVSASVWPPGNIGNPSPNTWSLKHVGFLGAVPPAVKGLAPFRPGAKVQAPAGMALCERSSRIHRDALVYLAEHPGIDYATAAIAAERPGFRCPRGYRVAPAGAELHRDALVYLAEHPGADFVTAVRAVVTDRVNGATDDRRNGATCRPLKTGLERGRISGLFGLVGNRC
ncbi:MAG: hypothetical protein IT472_09900, partial [Thermomonas sp.]|uniref:hypothetical protein n=1 Tax=Thermomonas sp. TaxID=1971895 RepID=UPI00261F29D6